MYKVFHENRCLGLYQTEFENTDSLSKEQRAGWDRSLIQIRNWLEDDNEYNDLNINTYNFDPVELLNAVFEIKYAAGGIVYYRDSLVVIDRNGLPDLPKGHLEKGEEEAVAALREVEEETGLHKITLLDKAGESFHCYQLEKHWILKRTAWYNMLLEGDFEPQPQREEGITAVRLVKKSQLDEFLNTTFRSVRETLGPIIKASKNGMFT
ncbi:MAG: NUDIX domain-containing protein [Bacteroidales bacterium]|nr:NUDIX domain-containing protein [Bacteroidales bacterium]